MFLPFQGLLIPPFPNIKLKIRENHEKPRFQNLQRDFFGTVIGWARTDGRDERHARSERGGANVANAA